MKRGRKFLRSILNVICLVVCLFLLQKCGFKEKDGFSEGSFRLVYTEGTVGLPNLPSSKVKIYFSHGNMAYVHTEIEESMPILLRTIFFARDSSMVRLCQGEGIQYAYRIKRPAHITGLIGNYSRKVLELESKNEIKVIEGHNCKLYSAESPEQSFQLWIAEDIPLDNFSADRIFGTNGAGTLLKLKGASQKPMFVLQTRVLNKKEHYEKCMQVKNLRLEKVSPALFSTSGFDVKDYEHDAQPD